MKKLAMMLMAVLTAGMVCGQEPVITFDRTTHDFGKINEADGRVTTVFTFKNEGMSALVLSNVRASCGCTTPKWTKEPVEPGQEGQITVTYNPNGRPGHFQKTITVTSNAKETTTRLFIKGEVIPKTVKPVDNFPVKMGKLSLAKDVVDFGNVKKGAQAQLTLAYANQKDSAFTLECRSTADYLIAVPAITAQTSMEIQPQQKGDIQLLLNADLCSVYGPVEVTVYMIINGEKDKEKAITIKANIVEDFSQMSQQEMDAAPILSIQEDIDLGTFAQGKKARANLQLSNAGTNPLLIRRILNTNKGVSITPVKSIRSGKKGNCHVTLPTDEKGTFIEPITVITNDPKNAVKQVMIRWTVE